MNQKPHTDREFEVELQRVRDNLLEMASQVGTMIANSTRSFVDCDLPLATRTIEADQKIDRLEVDTDNLCLLVLAKRQPLGSDLRFITAAMKMVTDLERIGDLAVNIAERTLAMNGQTAGAFAAQLISLSDLDRGWLREALDAFVARDADRAQNVQAGDNAVDQAYADVVIDVQQNIHADPAFLEAFPERGVHILAVAKFLERIGDHITNLAELVIFLVRGQDVRHGGRLDS